MIDILFKILKGPSSRISTDITEFHEGYAYVTEDGGDFYVDMVVNGENKRVQINPDEIPAGGTEGQLLTKTASGWEWKDAPKTVSASSTVPKMAGVAGAGNENAFARGDHVHPAEVFWATYGEAKATAFPKIQSAVEQNKIVLLNRDGKIYILAQLTSSTAAFISAVPSTAKRTGDGESSGYGIFLTNSGWSTDDVWQQFDPCTHSSTHAKDGADPIAPADIGAIASTTIVEQNLVNTETTPTVNGSINWVYA